MTSKWTSNTTPNGPVGQSIPRVEGPAKVKGLTKYTADVSRPGILWGKVLRSPLPHARILNINTDRAKNLPGVKAVIIAHDVSSRLVGASLKDMPVLARDRVRYVGEDVAAVAAVDSDTAEEALALIQVDYEELPAVFILITQLTKVHGRKHLTYETCRPWCSRAKAISSKALRIQIMFLRIRIKRKWFIKDTSNLMPVSSKSMGAAA